ncbi:unnamed protein product, partial [Staurois parvus]
MWARTQGPHDPLLPGGPMSCQSAPDVYMCLCVCVVHICVLQNNKILCAVQPRCIGVYL